MKENNNAGLLVRVCAFIVDMFLVSIVCALLSYPFINQENSQKINKELNEVMEKASKNEISVQTYAAELKPLVYQNDRDNGVTTIFILLVSILYFVVYQFKTKQTIGKKIFKIKLEANEGELTMNHMVFRGLIINSILFTLLTFIFVIFSNSSVYFVANITINSLYYLIIVISSLMIILRKDNRGLHDVICNTKVVKC